MAGAIIENMSSRKLAILGAVLLACQVLCFLVGAVFAPNPNNSDQFLATWCKDPDGMAGKDQWFVPRGKGKCQVIEDMEHAISQDLRAENIVYTFQLPHPRDGRALDYSRWQQSLIGVLMIDIEYDEEDDREERVVLMLDAKLGYRNKGDPEGQWSEYARSFESRNLDCSIDRELGVEERAGTYYNCSMLPLFDLGSLHHDYYLLNVRFPSAYLNIHKETIDINQGLGKMADIWLVAINQNGGFTRVWVTLKTLFFPIIIVELIWFWRRLALIPRPPSLLERMLMSLGAALTFLNLPIEYFTLAFEMPWLNLFNDVKQGVFYANLLVFWLIFAGEHLLGEEEVTESKGLLGYWKNLAVVLFGCLCLFVFDMCERGVQLQNPFYSIWVTDLGTNLALGFIILAGISAGLYFIFLCYMIRKVFSTISSRAASFQHMARIRRLHYQGIIWRFKFLMLATVFTAALTVIGFIIGQVEEGGVKWDEEIMTSGALEYTSGFMTGVYGMWNIYIFGLLFLYAPSHKTWANEDNTSTTGEEIEFDVTSPMGHEPSEMSSLTDFIRHQATD